MQWDLLDAKVYLIGLATLGAHPYFDDPAMANVFIASVRQLRTDEVFSQHAYVVLPNAYYAIITPADTITRAVSLLKRKTADALAIRALWAPGCMKQCIEDLGTLLRQAGTLHLLPVTEGLVEDPEDYPFSSLSSLDADPVE